MTFYHVRNELNSLTDGFKSILMCKVGRPELGVLKAEWAEDGIVETVEVDTEMSGFLLFMNQAADGSDGSEVWVFEHVFLSVEIFYSNCIASELYRFFIDN